MYGLIHNNIIQVGPRTWSYGFFNEYLTDNNLDNTNLPRNDPNSAIITSTWKILPVVSLIEPSYNSSFQQLAGPYWTINNDNITGRYDVVDVTVDFCKSKLKEIVTLNRYIVETGELMFTFSDGEQVQLYTTREDRSTYLDAYLILGDSDTITFKFVNGVFKTINKTELGQIVSTGALHIKNCFEWESNKHTEIDNCTTLDQLKLIETRHPSQID